MLSFLSNSVSAAIVCGNKVKTLELHYYTSYLEAVQELHYYTSYLEALLELHYCISYLEAL